MPLQHKTPAPEISLLAWVNAQEIAFQSNPPTHLQPQAKGICLWFPTSPQRRGSSRVPTV